MGAIFTGDGGQLGGNRLVRRDLGFGVSRDLAVKGRQ